MDETTPDHLLEEWDRDHVWHSFTQMQEYEPFIVESASGNHITDIHGNQYIDAVSSLWCNIHGHAHPVLNAAIEAQLKRVAHVTNLGASNTETIRLARRLAELTPGDLAHVFFCSDGANAIEVALKMAFQYWQQCEIPHPGRTKYIALSDAYHGDTIGTVSVGDVPLFHQLFKPLLFHPVRCPAPDTRHYTNREDEVSGVQQALEDLDKLLLKNANEVAAIVMEPIIQGAAGIKIQPEGYLRGVSELARKHDVLLIADEVAVGFGRTGTLFACEQESVVPDILCLGKGLSGGYLPISATVTSEKIYSAFLGKYEDKKTLYHGHTFAGNPLACAVSLANLDLFESDQTIEKLSPKISHLQNRIQRLTEGNFPLEHARNKGLVAAFDLVTPNGSSPTRFGYEFCDRVLRRGVRIRPLGSTVIIMPPLSISIEELDLIFEAVEASF